MSDRLRLLAFAILCSCFLLAQPSRAQLVGRQPEWYLPVSDGCRLFVQEFGRGKETIVVLHGGWGAEHSYLLDAFQGLDEQFHLVFYDQRGSLRSPCSVAQISVEKHIEDLEKLRLALGEERLNLVAHSMGTVLAQEYLQHYPKRVKGLVLLGTPGPKTAMTAVEEALWKEQDAAAEAFVERPEIAAELHRQGLDKEERLLTPQQITSAWRIRFAGANLYHVGRWQQMKGGRVFYNREAAAAASRTMPKEYDFTPALTAHNCPVWVLNGDHDIADPGAKKFQLAARDIPAVHIVVLKDAGHVAWVDTPDEFLKYLRAALASALDCH